MVSENVIIKEHGPNATISRASDGSATVPVTIDVKTGGNPNDKQHEKYMANMVDNGPNDPAKSSDHAYPHVCSE